MSGRIRRYVTLYALCVLFAVHSSVGPASAEEGPEDPPDPMPVVTRLSVDAPTTCDTRASVVVRVTLEYEDGLALAGQPLRIELRQSGVTTMRTASTDTSGNARITVKPTARMRILVTFAGTDELEPATSEAVSILPRVAFSAPWTHAKYAYPGQRLPARGTLWPKHSAKSTSTTLVCERYENGKWVVRARYKARIVNTKTRSRYEGVVRFPSSGTWRVRARHADSGHATTRGPVTKVRVSNWRKRYRNVALRGFKTKEKLVAITIDDGPNHRTSQVCDILESYGGRGTFFFTDHLMKRGYERQVRRTYNRGHEIANHTANHKMLIGAYSSSYYQVAAPKRTIKHYTGFAPTWVRAMGGGYDATGLQAVRNTDQLYANWSIDSYDSHRQYTPPDVLYRNVMRNVTPGSVILIHQTHPETIEALPRICRALKRKGYTMVTMSELAARSRPR